MKKVLFIMAAALMTMTQCKKQETMLVTPSADTIKMTVTAGPGRTDINTETGAITWSAGDKLYVSKNGSWLGYLTLVGEGGSSQGTFTGDVTGIGDGTTPCHFFYLGKGNVTTTPTGDNAVSISFAAQDGTIDGENGAMKYHIGHGRTDVTVAEGAAAGYVVMNTEIAMAHINFTNADSQDYTGSVTMGGTGISNTLTVNPNGTFSGSGEGGITIAGGTTGERYVTLIPTETTDVLNVAFTGDAFTGDATGSMTFAKGIHENKFYGMSNAIEVTMKSVEFSVGENIKVKFSPGNLYWDGSAFRFEANQWSFKDTWDASHVSHFFWSKSASVAYASSYSDSGASTDDEFFTNSSSFQVDGEDADTWRTLSEAEWGYLLNSRTNASGLRAWKDLGNNVIGLVILPDGTDASVMNSISSTADLASSGAVFLPAAGDRYSTVVYDVGSRGYCLSGTPNANYAYYAYYMYFNSDKADTYSDGGRSVGYAVRLVR